MAQLRAGQKAKALNTLRAVKGADGTADIARLWALQAGRLIATWKGPQGPLLHLYFGASRIAPSRRITSPLSMSLVTIWCTSLA